MTYEEALAYIHSVQWRGSRPGLSRTRELLEKLGNPERKLKFVHIAGTNGKGSAAAMLSSVLEQAGYKVGLYTSPFIHRFNERMQINGEMIADEELAELTEEVRPSAETMEDKPTEFEMITGLAMLYFYRHACDIVVLEVGMGGLLDSTNVIPVPELAMIMSIGLDHTKELGDTIAQIAENKAGIIKEGGDVVAYGQNEEAMAVFRRVCAEKNAHLYTPDYDTLNSVLLDLTGQIFDYGGFQNLRIPLLGYYQLGNAAVVVRAVEILNHKGWYISDESLREGLAQTRWRGRLELIADPSPAIARNAHVSREDAAAYMAPHPTVLVDGSHNPPGVEVTAGSLKLYFKDQKITFLVGVMADKDVASIMSLIYPLAGAFVTVTPDNPGRAMDAQVLAEKLRAMGDIPVTAADTIAEGCALALEQAGSHGVVCSLGSLFLVGDVTREMQKLLKEGK